MIVFWKVPWLDEWGSQRYGWRCYKGRAKLQRGRLHIYPCNGTRKRLEHFIAFDDSKSHPPTLLTPEHNGTLARDVDLLVKVGTVKEHLPPMYIDNYGNVRRTDANLSLVLMGPGWGPLQEEEFQEKIALPF